MFNHVYCSFYRELLTNVLDMVSVLISVVTSTEMSSGQGSDEARKATKATLFKKLKRELAGKSPRDIIQCKQLLPLPSLSHNVHTVEKDNGDKKQSNVQGLKINGKQKISAWDLMEGHKNPAPFAWSWFGAVRIERRPSRYEQEFRKLLHHTHIRRKPNSYFISRQHDDDVDDDEDEKMEADEGGDKSSLPSTPQTPAEVKGMCSLSVRLIFWMWCFVSDFPGIFKNVRHGRTRFGFAKQSSR